MNLENFISMFTKNKKLEQNEIINILSSLETYINRILKSF